MEHESSKKIRLIFFDVNGRAEMIRFLLTIARVPYEDVRLKMEEWPEWKAKHSPPFGQLPILEMDGKVYAQSSCILRVLSKKFGFYPKHEGDQFAVEMIYDICNDASNEFWGKWPKDESECKAYRKEFMAKRCPHYAGILNKILLENYPNVFFNGTGYTFADFIVLRFLSSMIFHQDMKEFNKEALQAGPQLEVYWNTRTVDLKEHLERRPQSRF